MVQRALLRDRVTFEVYLGDGPDGAVYAEPVEVWGLVEADRKLVRGAGGDEVTAEVTVTLHPNTQTTDDTDPAQPTLVPALDLARPESRVGVGDGRRYAVLKVTPVRWRGRLHRVDVDLG